MRNSDRSALGTARDDASRLRLDAKNDALRFASEGTQDFKRRFSRIGGSLPERYCNGDLQFHAFIHLAGTHVGELLFSSVPLVGHVVEMEVPIAVDDADSLARGCAHRQSSVDLTIPNFCQTPEGRITTFVRLKFQEEGGQLGGDLAVFASDILRGIFPCLSRGEFRVFRGGVSSEDSSCVVDGVVKRGTESVDAIKYEQRKEYGQGLGNSHLVEGKPDAGIVFRESQVWFLLFEKGGNNVLELRDVKPCPVDKGFWTGEIGFHA